HVFGRLVDAPLDVGLLFERARLGRHEPEHHGLVALGHEAQRLETPRAVSVVFEEIAVVVDPTKQELRDRLIAAFGNPGRAEIAAAHVGGHRHVAGAAFERLVDYARVDLRQLVDILAALARLLQLFLRAQIGPYRVVELQVLAARIGKRAHRLAVGGAEVVEEGVHVRIDVFADASAPAAEMQHARARDRHLARTSRVRLEKLEMLEHRVAVEVELADDAHGPRLGLHAVELDAMVGDVSLDAGEPLEEIEMPPRAPVLAVGDRLEAYSFLLLDDLLDLP